MSSRKKKVEASKPKPDINYGVNSIAENELGESIGVEWDLPPSVDIMEQTYQAPAAAAARAVVKDTEWYDWQNSQFVNSPEYRALMERSLSRPRLESLAAANSSQWGDGSIDYNSSGGPGEDALLRQSSVPDVGRVLASPYGWAGKDGKKPLDIADSLPTQEEINKAMKKKGGSRKKTRRRRRSRKKRTKRRKRSRKKRTKRRKRKSRRKR